MLSIQAKLILGIGTFVLVASALTIWLLLAVGNGVLAMIAPLVAAAVLLVVTRLVMRKKMDDSED